MTKAKKSGRYTPPKGAVVLPEVEEVPVPVPAQRSARRSEVVADVDPEAAALQDLVTSFRFVQLHQERLTEAVAGARRLGVSWDRIGQRVGINGETARKRWSR